MTNFEWANQWSNSNRIRNNLSVSHYNIISPKQHVLKKCDKKHEVSITCQKEQVLIYLNERDNKVLVWSRLIGLAYPL